MVGTDMVVYGGLDDKNRLLGDTFVFSYATSLWSALDVKGSSPGPLAYSAAVPIFPKSYYDEPAF